MQKKYFRLVILGSCLANLLVFARFYLAEYLPSVNLLEMSDLVFYILYYPAKLIEFCLTPLSAIVAFTLYFDNRKKLIISSLFLAIPRVVYLFPYYYLYENAIGNNSVESIGLSLLISVFGAAVLFAHILLLTLVIRLATTVIIKKQLCKEFPALSERENKLKLKEKANEAFGSEIKKTEISDLGIPVVGGIFVMSLIEFIYPLVSEIMSTVSFFTRYGKSYTTAEIFSIAFAFLFVLAELVILHVLGVLMKNLSLSMKSPEATEE